MPNPLTVDVKELARVAALIYPNVPSPRVVDVKLVDVTSPDPLPPPAASI